MAPLFIQRSRQRATEAQETFAEEPATSLPPRSRNPFMAAADDLASQWDEMRQERDVLRDEAEQLRGQNLHLAERVDSLTRELAHRIEFFELEIDRLTQRADRAVDENVDRRAKLEIIAKALRMVLDETIASAPIQREESIREHSIAAPSPRNLSTVRVSGVKPSIRNGDYVMQDFAQTPPEGHEVSEADAEDARDLINRLAPVALKR